MKKYSAITLLTLVCLVGLGVSAEGQEKQEVVVTVPYEFVAAGKTLPAGKYMVSRVNDQQRVLSIRSYDLRTNMFVMAVDFEGRSAEDSTLVFEQAGDMHFLSQIKTQDGVYSLPAPRISAILANAKQHQDMPVSGTK